MVENYARPKAVHLYFSSVTYVKMTAKSLGTMMRLNPQLVLSR